MWLSGRIDRIERVFLILLRGAALAAAATVLLTAAIYFGWGLIQQIGSTRSDPQPISVTAQDVTPPTAGENSATDDGSKSATPKPTLDGEVRTRTLAVYRAAFKKFERRGIDFDQGKLPELVWPEERIRRFGLIAGELVQDEEGGSLGTGKALSLDGLGKVEKAAGSVEFQKGLIAYRDAKKTQVCRDVTRTRSRNVSGWDRYSMLCSNWYDSPIGCPSTQTIDEPYTTKVCEMKFPENLDSPSMAMAGAINRYGDAVEMKLVRARIDAEERTLVNRARKLSGKDSVVSSGKLFLGFLALMFLYLFVVLERHHRSLRALLCVEAVPEKD